MKLLPKVVAGGRQFEVYLIYASAVLTLSVLNLSSFAYVLYLVW